MRIPNKEYIPIIQQELILIDADISKLINELHNLQKTKDNLQKLLEALRREES